MALRFVLGAVFAVAGVAKLASADFEVQAFAHFGYATWFLYAIGAFELLGGALLCWRRGAAFGAVLMLPVMVGAAASHLNAGDGVGMAAPAGILFLLLLVTVWAGRRGFWAVPDPDRQLAAG